MTNQYSSNCKLQLMSSILSKFIRTVIHTLQNVWITVATASNSDLKHIFQVGVRAEGIQEAILKIQEGPANVDRIARMKQVIKAVSLKDHCSQSFLLIKVHCF